MIKNEISFGEFNYTTRNSRCAYQLCCIEKLSSDGIRTYRLITSKSPNWQHFLCRLREMLSRFSYRLIDHQATIELLRQVANEQTSPRLVKEAQITNYKPDPNIFPASLDRQRILKEGFDKFHRAVKTAQVIGKGWLKIESKGLSPLILQPNYITEINRKSDSKVSLVSFHDRSRYAVEIVDGGFYRGGRAYKTREGKEAEEPSTDAFVISPEEKIYAGAIDIGKFHHSSFLQGGAVIFAGEFETNVTGHLVRITNRSGHYKPQKAHLLKALLYLVQQGVNLSNVEVQEYSSMQPHILSIYNCAKRYLDYLGMLPPDTQINT